MANKREYIKDRFQETRKFQERSAEERDAIIKSHLTMTSKNLLDIDPSTIPVDKDYCYIRESLMGNPDHYSLDEAAMKGWEPVTSQHRPDLASAYSGGGHMPAYIRRRELILHQRDKKYGQIERQSRQEQTNQMMNTLPGQDHFMDDPSMPMKVIHNSSKYS